MVFKGEDVTKLSPDRLAAIRNRRSSGLPLDLLRAGPACLYASAVLHSHGTYKRRMNWHFEWVSSHNSDFNYDFHVSVSEAGKASGKRYYNYEETESSGGDAPGLSVFYRDEDGAVYHTYSTYARGGDILIGAHNFLDMTPKGRNETTIMDRVRRHDEYEGALQVRHKEAV